MSALVHKRFEGVMRGGGSVTGWTTEPTREFVERHYRNRWQSLRMFTRDGTEVGGIVIDDSGKRRAWWER